MQIATSGGLAKGLITYASDSLCQETHIIFICNSFNLRVLAGEEDWDVNVT